MLRVVVLGVVLCALSAGCGIQPLDETPAEYCRVFPAEYPCLNKAASGDCVRCATAAPEPGVAPR